MRLNIIVYSLFLSSLFSASAFARPAPPPPPIKNLEITGQATQAGKPVAGVTVKAHFYNCDTQVQATTVSNQAGYYRLVIPSYPRTILTMRATTPEEKAARRKLTADNYTINRPLFMVRPIPIFVSATKAKSAQHCVKAVNGGLDAPAKNRFNVSLPSNFAPVTPNPITPKPPTPNREQQQCQVQGGKWERISRGVIGCNLTYKDGGRLCTDSKQCASGVCLAKDRNLRATEGQCANNTFSILNNCNGELKRGRWSSRPCP
ncbi:carboxypeptidase-like regulatory domain-containing protein [Thiolinea disciformis]|uniref:carboxypeptidase-like regulatory domain-containing protein n=1 Tax=Thiolinea disciformis TaxID=125614 RepID=UPI000376A188|nr:carboxypeptidase-like regulatory domain-containing protein [Thiolinea disciformis]